MNAVEALRAARAAGVKLAADGDDLALGAVAEPSASVLDELSRHKAEIVALLRPGRDGWSAEDWLAHFDERAEVAEFDNGLSRTKAEAHAFECCVAEWLNRTCGRSTADRCVGCGEVDQRHDPLQPFGTADTGCVWLHLDCWVVWHANRKAEAVTIMSEILRAALTKGDRT